MNFKIFQFPEKKVYLLGFLKVKCLGGKGIKLVTRMKISVLQIKRVLFHYPTWTLSERKIEVATLAYFCMIMTLGSGSVIHYLCNTLTFLEPMLVHTCVNQVHPRGTQLLRIANWLPVKLDVLLLLPCWKCILCPFAFM